MLSENPIRPRVRDQWHIELQHPRVRAVRNIDVAGAINRDAAGIAQRGGANRSALVTGGGSKTAALTKDRVGLGVGSEGIVILQHPVVALVNDVKIAGSINRDARWKAQGGAGYRRVIALRTPRKKVRLPDHQIRR